MQFSEREFRSRDVPSSPRLPQINSWDVLTEFVRRDLCDEESVRAMPFDVGQVVFDRLSASMGKDKWRQFDRDIRRLWSSQGEIPEAVATRLVKAADKEGNSIFRLLLEVPTGAHGIKELLACGVVPEKVSYNSYFDRTRRDPPPSIGSLLHLAASVGNVECVSTLVANGFSIEERDSSGRTPLQLCGAGLRQWVTRPSKGITKEAAKTLKGLLGSARDLLQKNANPLAGGTRSESFLYSYLTYLPHSQSEWLSGDIRHALRHLSLPTLDLGGIRTERATDAVDGIISKILRLREYDRDLPHMHELHIKMLNEAMRSNMTLPGLLSLVESLYAVRFDEGIAHSTTSKLLVPALPELLRTMPVTIAQGIASTIDIVRHQKESSPFEPELLAFFSHKKCWYKSDEDSPSLGEDLGLALSAPYDLKLRGIPQFSALMLENFTALGELTWSHKKWKFDSISFPAFGNLKALPTLLEAYGFKRLPDHPKLGSGFRVSGDWGTVELWRGCVFATIKGKGSIIGANSSTNFGRDIFHSPCFVSSDYYPLHHSETLRASGLVNSFYESAANYASVFSFKFNHDPTSAQRLSELVAAVRVRLNGLANWKCSTRREDVWYFPKNPNVGEPSMKAGAGYFSPGLKAILDRARRYNLTVGSHEPALGLAWVVPRQPPIGYLEFDTPTGERAFELPLTNKVINAIEGRILDTADYESAISSGEHAFFATGFAHQAELIVVDSRRRAS